MDDGWEFGNLAYAAVFAVGVHLVLMLMRPDLCQGDAALARTIVLVGAVLPILGAWSLARHYRQRLVGWHQRAVPWLVVAPLASYAALVAYGLSATIGSACTA